MGTVTGVVIRNGNWGSDCRSARRTGSYARFYTFTLSRAHNVRIDLTSSHDTYLYLMSGSRTTGSVLESDDDDGDGRNSRIRRRLASGTYTIEATTNNGRKTGAFALTVWGPAAPPTYPGPTPTPPSTCTVSSIGTSSSTVARTGGTWRSSCASTNRTNRYARFYRFKVSATATVRIDLTSSQDTYLYLLSGFRKSSPVLEYDDDGGSGLNSRIRRSLSPGTYVVEATTYRTRTTGSFTLTIQGLPTATPTASYLPNAGDLYYNGGGYADAYMRWDNPSWRRAGAACAAAPTDCSTYEHDLELDWSNNAGVGWFTVPRAHIVYRVGPHVTWTGSYPGYYASHGSTRVRAYGFPPPWRPPRIPDALFCTTWSNFPDFYNDCPTAGVGEVNGKIILSFGEKKAPSIVAGRVYYGYWLFRNQRGSGSTTRVRLLGQEGEYKGAPTCPRVEVSEWCVFGIDGRQSPLIPSSSEASGTTRTWTHGRSFYEYYQR